MYSMYNISSHICTLCSKSVQIYVRSLQTCNRRTFAALRQRKRKIVINETLDNKRKGQVIIRCKRPEFNFYEKQSYSKYEPIPLASNGWLHKKSRGDYFFVYPQHGKKNDETEDQVTFQNYNLDPRLVERLKEMCIIEPLSIQKKSIPQIMLGYNIVLAAETGCGKTMAYLIPMINQILKWKPQMESKFNSPIGLIVTPSRELAVQIGLEAMKLSKRLGICTKIFLGGRTKRLMLSLPVNDVDLVVASFGVISKLSSVKIYRLDRIRHVVLDEADALFHETFQTKLNIFLQRIPIGALPMLDENGIPKAAQLTLASATIPQRISEALRDIVNVDSLLTIQTEKLHRILVLQKFVRLGPSDKPGELLKFIKPKVSNRQGVIIFSNDNATCDWISMFLKECNIDNIHLNGAMPLEIRQGKYADFRSGKVNVLSATNIGCRGLDTYRVRDVLNYDFPLCTADYIHRCGRVGRVGGQRIEDCRVTNFISKPLEVKLVQKIERAIRQMKPIPIYDISKEGKEYNEEEQEEEEEEVEEEEQERLIGEFDEMEETQTIPY